jgi:hypothetical protein
VRSRMWQEVGRYDHGSGTYHIERVPCPPEARPIVERSSDGYSVILGWRMQMACPKCLADVELGWQRATMAEALRDRTLGRHVMAEAGAAEAQSAHVALAAIDRMEEIERRAAKEVRDRDEQIRRLNKRQWDWVDERNRADAMRARWRRSPTVARVMARKERR